MEFQQLSNIVLGLKENYNAIGIQAFCLKENWILFLRDNKIVINVWESSIKLNLCFKKPL